MPSLKTTALLICLLLYATCFAGRLHAQTYRIEAEDFSQQKQWLVSTAADASAGRLLYAQSDKHNRITSRFVLPESGTYTLWVRSYSHGQGYRNYDVMIDGKKDSHHFGDEQGLANYPGFTLAKGDSFELKKGEIRITLDPLSQYARCDALILTTDQTFPLDAKRETIQAFPRLTHTPGPTPDAQRILYINGGRPWEAKLNSTCLTIVGADFDVLDSAMLDGLGGAPIRKKLSETYEPPAQDGLTPAFEHLDRYRVLIVGAILREDQAKLFTPQRVKTLEKWVRNGGVLLLTENAPFDQLQNLMPVTRAENAGDAPGNVNDPDAFYIVSENPIFADLPQKWPYFGRGENITAKPGGVILATRYDAAGQPVGPDLVYIKIGSGKVIYWNTEWRRNTKLKQLMNWAYFGSVLTRTASLVADLNVNYAKLLEREQPPAHLHRDQETLTVRAPEFSETIDTFTAPSVQESADQVQIAFENEVTLVFHKPTLKLDAQFPQLETPIIRGMAPPMIISKAADVSETWDKDSSEAVGANGVSAAHANLNLTYRYESCEARDTGEVALTLSATHDGEDVGRVHWVFKPGTFNVNQRIYQGFADRFEIEKFSCQIESLNYAYPVAVGDNFNQHRAARMACYGKPRGYAEIAFSNQASQTTGLWQHFAGGQPFNWITSDKGLYCEFVDTPIVDSAEIANSEAPNLLEVRNNLLVGWRKAPMQAPYLWRLYCPENDRTVSAWMGMYQFLRMRYCQQAGLRQPEALPTASYSDLANEQQLDRTIAAAKKLNFVDLMLPLPLVRHVESLNAPAVTNVYQKALQAGLRPKPWNPGGYYDSYDYAYVVEHLQYFFYKRDGELVLYFDKEPIADFTNDGYFEHYKQTIENAHEKGMRDIYLDMAGAYAQLVNYSKSDTPSGITGLERIFKLFSELGINPCIEGQNPLAIDNFWYRKERYVSHSEKEFAFTGMSLYTNPPDHVSMDYFRLGMHNAYFTCNLSGYANGMDTAPEESRILDEVGPLNQMFNAARQLAGIPFVERTESGTIWLSANGAVVFAWDSIGRLDLNLPDGWAIASIVTPDGGGSRIDGSTVYDVPHKSAIFIHAKPTPAPADSSEN